LSRTPCALCHTRAPDSHVRYQPEYEQRPDPFNSDAVNSQREPVELPVCSRCRRRSARLHRISRSLGCLGLLGILVGVIGITVATFSDTESTTGLFNLLTISSGAVGIGLIVLIGPARWVLQHWEQRQISHWLQIHRPALWREITSVPSAEETT
jgi:predicted ribosomally synthesized peptide with SipW-like signal peptide